MSELVCRKTPSVFNRTYRGKMLCLAAIVLCLGLAAAVPAQQASGGDPSTVQWKTGAQKSAQAAQADAAVAIGSGTARHVVMSFSAPLTASERAALSFSGIELLRYLGANSYFASVQPGKAAVQAAQAASVFSASEIDTAWKLHPMVASESYPDYAVFKASSGATTSTLEEVETVALYVVFHGDVEVEAEGAAALERHNGTIRDYIESINAVVAWVPRSDVEALAAEDAVQWIEPPLPPLEVVNDSNRVLTQADTVAAAPYGLDGTGINVLVYDGGSARASHADFGGRLTVRDSSTMDDHPTHVSGTIGGDGAASGGVYRGMAPGVVIQSYGFEYDGTGHWLYTNPGDLEDDYDEAINTHGAELSNNSIGSNVAPYGYPCEWEGDYGATSMLVDAIVGGSLGDPMRVVWSNGNENGYYCGTGYHLTAPPSCAKNHITVGAVNANDDSMTQFSSWGPTDDGRLKPDVVGPGCQSDGDYGVTSCGSSSDTAYVTMCGTSMSAPTVTGLCALILQDWKALYPGDPLPRNSTLKALLTHNAQDLGTTGPDFVYGYGSVRVKDTVDFLRTGSLTEASLDQGGEQQYLVQVPSGADTLKATLAWDDPPGAVNTYPELVNDLDVVAIAPDGETTYYPWTLDPSPGNEANPAVRTAPDRVNNIEQVVVDSPAEGWWTIQVSGYAVPDGPQVYSLTVSPDMQVSPGQAGTILLDESTYTCEDTLVITVSDSGLADSVTVQVDSTTEAAGEAVVLTETGTSTGIFQGTIAISATDDAGVLQVTSGDTITATYDDDDDGTGNPATVTDTAAVDCDGPIIASVAAADVGRLTATITFETDEPAVTEIHCGLAAGGPYTINDSGAEGVAHTFVLDGLTPGTTYYYRVEAEDGAGNATVDDNGGGDYQFTTSAAIVPPFVDGFESGALTSWDVNVDGSGNSPVVAADTSLTGGLSPHAGSYVARLGDYTNGGTAQSTLDLVLDLSDSLAVELSFWWVTYGLSDGQYVRLDVFDGAWHEDVNGLAYNGTDWQFCTVDLSGYDAINGFIVRFRSSMERTESYQAAYLDNVTVSTTPSDDLLVTPHTSTVFSGEVGGPFSPTSAAYTVENNGASPVVWTLAKSEDWLDVAPVGGVINAGASTVVLLDLNAGAETLGLGQYVDTLTFTNTSSGVAQQRNVTLDIVQAPPEIRVETPAPLEATLFPGQSVVFDPGFSIFNDGEADLEYSIRTRGDAAASAALADVSTVIDSLVARSGILDGALTVESESLLSGGVETYTLSDPSEVASMVSAEERGITAVTPLNVAVCGAELPAYIADVQSKLVSTGDFGSVSTINVSIITPTAAELASFDAVLVWSDWDYANYAALGDALADYADAGGGVVCAVFEVGAGRLYYRGQVLGGRWEDDGYPLMDRLAGAISGSASLGTVHDPGHPIMRGVETFNGGSLSYRPSSTALNPEATVIAEWSDGNPLVAAGTVNGASIVDLGFFPLSDDIASTLWDTSTDGAQLMANSLMWTAGASTAWLTVAAPDAGAIAGGDSVAKTVTFDAERLTAGTYRADIEIHHNDSAQTSPVVLADCTLTVVDFDMSVSPETAFSSSGVTGNTFSPSSETYTLSNDGAVALDWTAAVTESWLEVSPAGGSLDVGATVDVTVSFSAAAVDLPVGSYTDEVVFTNATSGYSLTRDVDVTVLPELDVTPQNDQVFRGTQGGPFSPETITYTLQNGSGADVDWTASASQSWLDVSPDSGTLPVGNSVDVTVSLNAAAGSVSEGVYSSNLTINDVTNSAESERLVLLDVYVAPEGALHWFTMDTDPGWSLSGQWAFGVPQGRGGDFLGNPDPTSGATGDAVYGINLDGDYVPSVDGPEYLMAGPFDCSGFGEMELQFSRWLNAGAGPEVVDTVEVSNDGATWTTLWSTADEGSVSDDDWVFVFYDISAVADDQPAVYVRWGHELTDEDVFPMSGWNLDDVGLFGEVLDDLQVLPEHSLHASGLEGGPFTPSSMSYFVRNNGTEPLSWTALTPEAWLDVTPSSGTLANPGDYATVTVELNAGAATLPLGMHTAAVNFTNTGSGVVRTRQAVLGVYASAAPADAIAWFPMDADPGWDTEGNWAYGQPTGGGLSTYSDPTSGYTGDNVYGYNLNGDYANNMPEYALTTVALDCSGYENVTLSFWRWLVVDGGAYDGAGIYVSNDGCGWTEVWSNATNYVDDTAWQSCTYDISAVADNEPTVYVRWTIGPTDSSGAYPGWNIDDVLLSGDAMDTLQVSPDSPFEPTGPEGGPFTPQEITYTLTNGGAGALEWTAATGAAWLDVSPASGTLSDPGDSVDVTVSVNAAADALGVGAHADSVTFSNVTSAVDQTRSATLLVEGSAPMPFTEDFEDGPALAPYWEVSGTNQYRTRVTTDYGPHGGSYHLLMDAAVDGVYSRNETTLTIDLESWEDVVLSFWAIDFGDEAEGPPASPFVGGADFDGVAVSQDGVNWYEIQDLRTLTDYVYTYVTVDLDAAVDALGLTYNDAFQIRFNHYDNYTADSDGIGIDDISISGTPDDPLAVSPDTDFEFGGVVGGPFTPASTTYTITNDGTEALAWTAEASEAWFDVTPASGTLSNPGDSEVVTVALNATADALPEGTYTGVVTFTNTATSVQQTRDVALMVGALARFSFDTDPGWTTEGSWAFGQPTGGGSHNLDPTSGHTGANVYGYNLSGDYPNLMSEESLTTTAIDCSGYEDVSLRFWRWLGVENSDYDHAAIRVSNDGAVWTDVWTHTGGSFSDNAWTQYEYDISAVADGQSTVYVRWVMGATDDTVTYPGWNIDDVEIVGIVPADFSATPLTVVEFVGPEGGPFTPASDSYTLENTGASSLDWTAEASETWLDLSSSGGTLAAGGSEVFTVAPNAAAESLSTGTHSAWITFTDTTNGVVLLREVELAVTYGAAIASVPFVEDWEGLGLGAAYWEVTGTNTYRTQVTTDYFPHGGSYHVAMDSSSDGAYARNELTLSIDLAGHEGVVLDFWAVEYGDESNGPPASPFTDGADFDGVAVSEDGTTWYEIQALRGMADSTYTHFTVDLDAAVAAVGLSYNGSFKIRFNQYDNFSFPSDGICIDDIVITSDGSDDLTASPMDFVSSTGYAGGPFLPASTTYTLTNAGATALDWSGTPSAAWLDVTPSSGTLAGGASEVVTVALTVNAEALVPGTHSATTTFTNDTTGDGRVRAFELEVVEPIGVTPAEAFTSTGNARRSLHARFKVVHRHQFGGGVR